MRKRKLEGIFQYIYWDDIDEGAFEGPLNDWHSHETAIFNNVSQFRTVVQAGGNCGMYPLFLSRMFDKVITFEPDKTNFEILSTNIEYHKIKNIQAMNFALGEDFYSTGLRKVNPMNCGMHYIDSTCGTDISVVPLDWYQDDIDSLDLIWFDMEGYEYNALMGSMELINQYNPVIMVENANNAIDRILVSCNYHRHEVSHMDTLYKKD